jgi:hypothetical protein
LSSSVKIPGADLQISVDRSYVPELEEARTKVHQAFSGMSDDALRFAAAQDRYDRALKASNGRVTASVRSAELNLRRVQQQASTTSAAVVKSANESSSALHKEEQAFSRVGRGALSGSGLVRGLGRSVLYASSTFLGAYGFISVIESATKAAEEQQVQEGQLETALKNRGQVVEQLRGQITGLVAANAKLGFGEHDVTAALTLGVTTTGSLAGATRLLSVAQNVARAKGIDLYAATQLVVKGFLGQSRGLKSLGVDIGAGVKGWQALDAVQAKYSGRAVAFSKTNAGAFATERAELEQTRVTIGNELLPAELKLANAVSGYLGKAENQKKIQHDVNAVMTTAGHLAHDVKDVYDALAPAVGTVNGVLGGTERTVKLLAGAFIAMKLGVLPALFGNVAAAIKGVGTQATVATGEVNGLATAEGRAAGAGAAGAVGGGLVPLGFGGRGAPGADPTNPIPNRDLRAPGGGFGARLAAKFGAGAVEGLTLGGGGFLLPGLSTDVVPNAKVHTGQILKQNGKQYVIIANAQGGILQIVTLAQYKAALKQQRAKPQGSLTNNGFTTANLAAPTTGAAGSPPVDRLTRINLAVSAAQTGVARGDKGAQTALVAALKGQIDYDRHYETIQEGLLKTDVKHRAEHAAILQQLYGQEQSAEDQITGIEQANAAKVAEARAKRAAAHKAALAAHGQALSSRLGGIEGQITTAQTAEGQAPNIAKLKAAQERERHARQLLIDFYVKESHDPQLTKAQQGAAVKNAASARQALAKSVTDDRAAALKQAVDTAESARLAATEGTAAYTRATAAEKKALTAEIAYHKAREHNAKLPLAAKRSATAAELAAQRQLHALDKTPAVTGDARANEAQFLSAFQAIIQNVAPNATPVGSGKAETHLYNLVHENRRSNSFLSRIVRDSKFPGSGYALASSSNGLG